MTALSALDAPANDIPPDTMVSEEIRGHFFVLRLYAIAQADGSCSLTDGVLEFGTETVRLDREHAAHLEDRVRAAIDNCVAGSIIHRPAACRDGH
jgi:hypothetical protein